MDSPRFKEGRSDANVASSPASKFSGIMSLTRSSTLVNLERTDSMITIGKLKLRGQTDNLPQYALCPTFNGVVLTQSRDWWFASTAIPLLAATIGPLANVLSIAALVTRWRVTLPDNGKGKDNDGVGIPEYVLFFAN